MEEIPPFVPIPGSGSLRATTSHEHMRAMRARQRELIAAGDASAKGGRGRRREGRSLLSPAELKDRAQLELQAQLEHRDPKIRRDAARLVLEMTSGRFAASAGDGIEAVSYYTAALGDFEDAEEREPGEAAITDQNHSDRLATDSRRSAVGSLT